MDGCSTAFLPSDPDGNRRKTPADLWFEDDWMRELVKHLVPEAQTQAGVTVQTMFGPYYLDLVVQLGSFRVGFNCASSAASLDGLWRDSALVGGGGASVVYRLRPLDLARHMADCLYAVSRSDPGLFGPRGRLNLSRLASDAIQRCHLPQEELLVWYPKDQDENLDADPSGDPEDVCVEPCPHETEGSLHLVRRDRAVLLRWYEYARRSGARTAEEVMQHFAAEHLSDTKPDVPLEQRAGEPGFGSPAGGSTQSSDICRWVRVGVSWAVTGPELLLKYGRVTVQARNKSPEDIWVSNVRKLGDIWIADKVTRHGVMPQPSTQQPTPPPQVTQHESPPQVRVEPKLYPQSRHPTSKPPRSPSHQSTAKPLAPPPPPYRRPDLLPKHYMPCWWLEEILGELAGAIVLKATLKAMNENQIECWKAQREHLTAAIWREQKAESQDPKRPAENTPSVGAASEVREAIWFSDWL